MVEEWAGLIVDMKTKRFFQFDNTEVFFFFLVKRNILRTKIQVNLYLIELFA